MGSRLRGNDGGLCKRQVDVFTHKISDDPKNKQPG
jgi:hypothetical protein